jgi:hypothetical protein
MGRDPGPKTNPYNIPISCSLLTAHCSRPHLGQGEFFQQQPAYHTRDPFKDLLGISVAHRTSHGLSLLLNAALLFVRSAIRISSQPPASSCPRCRCLASLASHWGPSVLKLR